MCPACAHERRPLSGLIEKDISLYIQGNEEVLQTHKMAAKNCTIILKVIIMYQ